MKGNVGKHGKSFKNRVKYILKDDHDFICSNMTSDSNNINELTDEFKSVSKFRQDIKKPVFHAFLSLPPNENITDEKWEEIAKDYLKEMNIDIEKHQYICVRHKDTDKDHIHIVANRIGLDGSVWHGQHDLLKTISACGRLEVKHNLTITDGLKGQKSDVSAPTKAEIEMALRTGDKPARLVLQASIQAAMAGKADLGTFVERLQAVGIEPRFNVASTGNVAGVSFSVNDIAFKGSSLGKKFSWNTIKAKVKYDKNRDDEIVRRFSARKTNDENSSGRSLVEPDFNSDRASDRINDDTIRISQYSIKSDTTSIREDRENGFNNIIDTKSFKEYDRQTNRRFRNTKQKNTQILNGVKKQHYKKSNKINNQSRFNRWHDKSDSSSISRILYHAETATTATDKFRLKSRGNINSRAAKIEEIRNRLGISKPIIVPKNKEKIIQEEIKKKPSRLSEYENRLKLKLKSNLEKESSKLQQLETVPDINYPTFKPK
ncbi:TPA: relaxase/mobilization nuclease domain-containing protein [Salmonella enterica subsp. houtenae]|nr:relaxase [Salmonella enterica subsp. houtenae]ECT3981199.1 relaxase [Salmonella enterica subsp. houtenae serovar 53:z4,z23:-]EGI6182131.1 relaxase/mobilization nuclease domain-containing protein [Salmonella enterica subsp. houtenae serovar 51:z4,z23:-]EKO1017153.1 relaxase/mobilization nuclease domain-containing protein [Salmonella enterica subsp. enterica]ECF6025879.1 relaxase [Salmonella enterica subsp. houtenae]